MKIHEYQSRQLMQSYDIKTTQGSLAKTPEEAYEIAKKIGKKVVVKAQVHTGGRGKAGGVILADNPSQAKEAAEKILNLNIKGYPVKLLLVAEAATIEKEFYLGLILDRQKKAITIMLSEEGGVDIEEVSEKTPEKILKASINPLIGILSYQVQPLVASIFKDKNESKTVVEIIHKLYKLALEKDADLVEINPLARTPEGIIALDAKITFDENSYYRHPEFKDWVDPNYVDPNEELAKEYGLSYVPLDGNIGCLVNGAGLSMATLDVINHYKGKAANFLDVGGSSNSQKVVAALKIICSNPKVKVILFNIFGGITRCDDIANGLLAALKESKVSLPIIIRLTGTNEEIAKKIIREAAYKNVYILDAGMNESIQLAVEKANQ